MKKELFSDVIHPISKNKGFKKMPGLSEVFLDGSNVLSAKDRPFSLNISSAKWRITLVFILLVASGFFLIARSYILQVQKHEELLALADKNRFREYSLQPERGVIYDRQGRYLVRNKPAFSVNFSPAYCMLGNSNFTLCRSVINQISMLLPVDQERVYKEIDQGKTSVILSRGLSKEQVLAIEANISKYPGISVSTDPQRDYLYKEAFAHVIGYVGIGDSLEPVIEGKMGVEESYNDNISGSAGKKTLQVDALGQPLVTLSETPPVPGKNLTLYLDLPLQNKAYEIVKKIVDEKKAEGAAVVAQDPRTGGILAMVSYPTFDPDKMSGGITEKELAELNSDSRYPFFNRAIGAAYPPGSTFKMLVAAAALSEKVITEHTIVNDPGYIAVGSYVFRNWKLDGHGEVNLQQALQVSNDTYFYTVGGGYQGQGGLGIEKLSKWAKRFGFGRKTNIDIPGETDGFMPDGEGREWYLGDTYITSIGQGDVLSTPLQVNNYITYFANGGYLYKPRVVKSIEGEKAYEPEIITGNLIDRKYLDLIRSGMHLVVKPGGTAYPLFDFSERHGGIELAGKTGTSEYIDSKGEPKTHAWLSVFGPYEEKKYNANIALTVFLEGGGGGSDDAAPIAKELLDLWFSDYSSK